MKTDGRKQNNGQPKKEKKSKKKHIAIYESIGDIEELGGMDAVRKILRAAFDKALKDKALGLHGYGRIDANSAA